VKGFWSQLAMVVLALGACREPPEKVALVRGPKQILFGDLHAHSSYSTDALLLQSSFLGGNGFRTPETHCDYARFCSRLDFWSINDHPEGMWPELWRRTKDAVRRCNQLEGGDSHSPKMVTFLGWEWTQDAESPDACFGHKNVILKETAEDKVPARSIGSPSSEALVDPLFVKLGVSLLQDNDPDNAQVYKEIGDQILAGLNAEVCQAGVDTRTLPDDCREVAADPAELYKKLSQWGAEALVIPHGNAWGWRHPPLSAWDNQLDAKQHDPTYQRLIEVFSGHGSSEVYRDWRSATADSDGVLTCSPPTEEYLPCCWQAGEIVRQRSATCVADPSGAECEAEVASARSKFLELPFGKRWASVGSTTAADWLDCGQCRDCSSLPAYLYRPGSSVQAALALSKAALSFRWGIIGSTDSHRAGPGAGYKELPQMADTIGPGGPELDAAFKALVPALFPEWERMSSFMYTGALAAVHAEGRSREAIWQGLQRRETYGTSGDRILLWFDLLNGPEGVVPMGGEARLQKAPLFEVKAVGSFKQQPGCPPEIVQRAPEGFIENVCFGECYYPTDQRYLIRRVEVVKIEPQLDADDDIGQLIQDPYHSLNCPPDPEGCVLRFADPDFATRGRPALYYVRAFQEPTYQFNADGLRCTDADCTATNPCPSGYRGANDTCMAPEEELAWSSPIFLDP
jgi:hypothetical protein